jgi:hypothetical protein
VLLLLLLLQATLMRMAALQAATRQMVCMLENTLQHRRAAV